MPLGLKVSLLFLSLLISAQLRSQVLPKEGSSLNYRIIGFSFPATKLPKDNSWKIEIAGDNYNDTAAFRQNIIHITYLHNNKAIIEVPAFGRQYTWRVLYTDNPTAKQTGTLHHFSTGIMQYVDTNFIRLRILRKAIKYKEALVFLDENRALYNMEGQPVWFLPKIDSLDNNNTFRDIKLSPQGTITVSNLENVYEVNYQGKILWKGPNNEAAGRKGKQRYHHEFTRLNNGHYMTLGSEHMLWKKDNSNNFVFAAANDTALQNKGFSNSADFGTVIEYDSKGNVVWSWSSFQHFKRLWSLNRDMMIKENCDMHENSFFFDERTRIVYVSFKNINRVIKIKYPGGEILSNYGACTQCNTAPDTGDYLFCMQHSCKISQQGYLYLFNNNTCHSVMKPQLLMMQELQTGKDCLKTIWEYEYPVQVSNQEMYDEIVQMPEKTVGGNMIELQNRDIFASLCSPYNDIFIVSQHKRLLWDAVSEKWDADQRKWLPYAQYRASIIKDHDELSRLIWNKGK